MDWVLVVGGAIIAYLVLQILRAIVENRRPRPPPEKWSVGGITEATLATYCGADWSKPTLLAVQGVLYDVSAAPELYGQGLMSGKPGSHAVYSGRECARALAKGSLQVQDCCADLSGCSEAELARLQQATEHIRATYDEVGKLVPMQRFTLEQLSAHDGSNPELPMLIAIRGVVFDVSTGKQFYGPNGIYPFAGHEVARAFALTSTELSDCHADLSGLGAIELDNLREWEAKFNSKYPVVGTLVGDKEAGGK